MSEFSIASGIVLSLISAGFFSGMEYAFARHELNKASMPQPDSFTEKILKYFRKKPFWIAGTIRIGKILTMAAALYFIGVLLIKAWLLFAPGFGGKIFFVIILILIIAIALLILDVQVKFVVQRSTSQLIHSFIIPFGICFIFLFPLVWVYITLTRWTARTLKLDQGDYVSLLFSPEVNTYSKNKSQSASEADIELDKKIFQNALQFKHVKVRDCMIPRTEIAAIASTAGIEKLREAFVESGHSKIVVFGKNIDDIIGYCHSAALFKRPSRIEDILTPIISVPENTLANDLMVRFISEQKSLAVVIDEFGGTSGMVSMEDVIEEIFGEIEDEHDEDDLVEQKLNESTYLFSARLEIDYLNETYKLNLPAGDYDTLGGLILSFTEDFPEVGKTILSPPFTFTVQSTVESRIDTVKIAIQEPVQEV